MKQKLASAAPFGIAALLNLSITLILSGLFSGFSSFSLDKLMLPAFFATTISFFATSYLIRRRDGQVVRQQVLAIALGALFGIFLLVFAIGLIFIFRFRTF